MSTLDELARSALGGPSAEEAIEFHDHWFKWGELAEVASEVAILLGKSGVDPRAPIAFVPRNRPSALAAELGMIASRLTIRMIYAFQAPVGIGRDVTRSNAGALVAAAEDFTPEVLQAVRERGMAAIALTEMAAVAMETAHPTTAASDGRETSEPAIEVHTSGTTGPPKHVSFSYEMIERHIIGQNLSAATATTEDSSPALLTFPLGNISGLYSFLVTLLRRRPAILLDRFSLDAWRDYVRRFSSAMPMLPPAAVGMVLEADIPAEELSCIKMIMTGAAPLDPAIQSAFEKRYAIPILLAYGATEFGGPVTAMTPDLYARYGASKLGTVGRPFAGAELRVIDPDSGEELASENPGLLEVMTPRMGSHWIRTTDLGTIDEDGFVFLHGRSDGAIIRGGFKLLPETIERALCLHSAVAAAAVVGLKDARLGEVPAAAIQIRSGMQSPSPADLEQHLRQHVYATHIPARWAFVDALPRNPSVKIDLPAVRALFGS